MEELNYSTKSESKFGLVLLTIIITAIVVSGLIYTWQTYGNKIIKSDIDNEVVVLDNKLIDLNNQEDVDLIKKEIKSKQLKEDSLHVYSDAEYGLQFKYPEKWVISKEDREHREKSVRMWNQEYEGYEAGDPYPDNFLGMKISYVKESLSARSYNDIITFEEASIPSLKKEIIKNKTVSINVYEGSYNEKNNFGPYLVAIWQKDGFIFIAETVETWNKGDNEKSVKMLKQILSTIGDVDEVGGEDSVDMDDYIILKKELYPIVDFAFDNDPSDDFNDYTDQEKKDIEKRIVKPFVEVMESNGYDVLRMKFEFKNGENIIADVLLIDENGIFWDYGVDVRLNGLDDDIPFFNAGMLEVPVGYRG